MARMPAGYSTRSLPDKLGIKPGFRIALVGAPKGYDAILVPLPPGVVRAKTVRGPLDLIQVFATSVGELARRFPTLKRALAIDGALWVSWPKRASGVVTDLGDGPVREIGLAHGLVDIKVCAVDEVWSGLEFVYRLADRKKATRN
jgi:hypothetical protein